jgi:hypothetical protein
MTFDHPELSITVLEVIALKTDKATLPLVTTALILGSGARVTVEILSQWSKEERQ